MAEFKDIARLFRKLSDEEKERLELLSGYIADKAGLKYVERLIKQKKVCIEISDKNDLSWFEDSGYPKLVAEIDAHEIKQHVQDINDRISAKMKDDRFIAFSRKASTELPKLIAQGIVGFDSIKKAVAIQLFSKEKVHILLLGDPGTGKTKILDSATKLHPISSMGLGSGTSSAGLAVTVRGNEIIPGLLPMADEGLCAIDELNLMKDESRASLYNAMESGFVSYDKGGKHCRFDARISVLATANPKGDKFKGSTPAELKKQLPFDPALLSRFHMVFLVRRPDVDAFKEISRSILSGKKTSVSDRQVKFIKQYIEYANQLKEPEIPSRFEKDIIDFVGEIKQDEKDYLIEVSPRLVIGFMRMAKALARSELRLQVEEKDISTVKEVIKKSLSLN